MNRRFLATLKTPSGFIFIVGLSLVLDVHNYVYLGLLLVSIGIVGYSFRWYKQEHPVLWLIYLKVLGTVLLGLFTFLILSPSTFVFVISKQTLVAITLLLVMYVKSESHTHKVLSKIRKKNKYKV